MAGHRNGSDEDFVAFLEGLCTPEIVLERDHDTGREVDLDGADSPAIVPPGSDDA